MRSYCRSFTRRPGVCRTRARVIATTLALASLVAAIPPPDAGAREPGPHGRDINLAKQSLALGDVEEAIRIFGRVLEADPGNERAFWGLVDVYGRSGMDREHLIPLLQEWLEERPDDGRARKELGAAHARLGEHDRAHEVWMDYLRDGEQDAALYSEIGSLELRHRMSEHAVDTYLEARRLFGLPRFFAEELVRAYSELGRVEEAIGECVNAVLEHSGVIQWAVNRVELLLDEGASERDVKGMIDEIAEGKAVSSSVLSFAGSVYIVLDRPALALQTFLLADEAARDDGRLLLELADLLDDAGLWAEASDAYLGVAERHSETMYAAKAGVAYGRGLAREGRVEEALAALRGTGERYTQFGSGGEALLAAAELELRALGDPEAALSTVDALLTEQRSRGKELNEEAGLLRIRADLALGRFDDAHSTAERLLSGRLNNWAEERASYYLGFSSLLGGEHRRALAEFRTMIEADAGGVLVNDALRHMLLIAEAEETGEHASLRGLAKAHQASIRGDADGATLFLEEVIETRPGTAAATEAMLLLGAVASSMGDYERALEIYARVAEESASLTARAEAFVRSGDILLHELGRADEAVERYTAVLAELPTNALSGEARRKIEAARKNGDVEG